MQSDSTVEEIGLHFFFKQLEVEYQVFQANDPESMEKAVKSIDAQQNLPLTYMERLPRVDYSQQCFALALASCLILAAISAVTMGRWT